MVEVLQIFGILTAIEAHSETHHWWPHSDLCQLRLDQEDEALKQVVVIVLVEEHVRVLEKIVAKAVAQFFDVVFLVDQHADSFALRHLDVEDQDHFQVVRVLVK